MNYNTDARDSVSGRGAHGFSVFWRLCFDMKVSECFPDLIPDENGLVFADALSSPLFRITGLPFLAVNGNYHRLDDRLSDKFSKGLALRTNNTSGVQLSVRTSSDAVGLRVKLDNPEFMEHMPDDATSSFDIYRGSGVCKKFWHVIYNGRPRSEFSEVFHADGDMEDYTFYFPLFSGIEKLEIVLRADADIEPPVPFRIERPVLFYGSSITQGGCVSRPGNLYVSMIGRMLDVPTVCMGFSSNAQGEAYLAESFAGLDLSAFVMDYDHNAANAEYLERTHSNFFRILRSAKPDMPIVIVSKPDFDDDPVSGAQRRNVILKTYTDALDAGDKNVWFVDGERIFDGPFRDSCTVDRNHPSDIGHMRMALVIGEVLGRALGLE